MFGSGSSTAQTRKTAQGFCFKVGNEFKRAGKQSSLKDCSGVGLETGRFQPAMRTSAKAVLSRSRFSREPDAVEVLSD
ncbi:hypothetical protein [Desulfitobacterium dehalogenans]|uniref:hypothetical protein n=1 Tax=Desulfitobacterium dehalogenans TaxID=36854 RepID=UPI0002E80D0D|nr:hypothetical protein [Desulfitobacterium dehalogenans]